MNYNKNCTTCHRKMVALFLTQRCDWCDFGPDPWRLHRGFVVYNEPDCTLPACARMLTAHHVFRTAADAYRLKEITRSVGEVRAVLSIRPFAWILTKHQMVIADCPRIVHPDHRFPDVIGDVFLAPKREEE